jgi:hypothetical protein
MDNFFKEGLKPWLACQLTKCQVRAGKRFALKYLNVSAIEKAGCPAFNLF